MWNLLNKPLEALSRLRKKTVTDPTPTPSPKYTLSKDDLPKILKAWAAGAALAIVTFTGAFLADSIDWGELAGIIALILPPVITAIKEFLSGPAE